MNLQDFIFYIHLASLAVAAGGVLCADHLGLSWMRGKVQTLSPTTLHRLHDVLSYSLSGLILSGLYLFWPMHQYLLTQPIFLLKLGFVAVLVINSIAINKLMVVATKVPFRVVSAKGKVVLFISGALSFVSWVGAGIAALVVFGL